MQWHAEGGEMLQYHPAVELNWTISLKQIALHKGHLLSIGTTNVDEMWSCTHEDVFCLAQTLE